ncbi:unnamed protein product [Ilex paraguariensis]|uniref:Uncharacterized protein n=1 Tax=Ilex paraguariensis TaxID=185542 RepID=A0ABC8RCY7_9AQUA
MWVELAMPRIDNSIGVVLLRNIQDVRYLIEDLLELKPTFFCGVPRVFDRAYTGIMDKISSGGALKKTLFQCAYNYLLRNLKKVLQENKATPLLDRLVFYKVLQKAVAECVLYDGNCWCAHANHQGKA